MVAVFLSGTLRTADQVRQSKCIVRRRHVLHHKCTIRHPCLRATVQSLIVPAEAGRTNVLDAVRRLRQLKSPTENGNPARETGTQSQASPVEAPDYRRGEDCRLGPAGNSSIRGSEMRARS